MQAERCFSGVGREPVETGPVFVPSGKMGDEISGRRQS